MKLNKIFISLILIAVLLSPLLAASAQDEDGGEAVQAAASGSEFTYQGYLTDNAGAPIHDSCEINVGLWDALTGGSRLGEEDVNKNVQVMEGYFTLKLNDAGQYGAGAFDGAPRFMEISVRCDGSGEQQLLSPRQPLSAAPYAVYAAKGGPHIQETWEANVNGTVLTIDNTNTTGTALKLNGSPLGWALNAEGAIRSTGLSKLELSPYDLILLDSSDTGSELRQGAGGSMQVGVKAGETTIVALPVQTFGTLFGASVYVHSLEVCYSTTANTYIDLTYVSKRSADGSGIDTYLASNDHQGEDTYTCYEVTAPTPRKPVDSATWIELAVKTGDPMGGPFYLDIYSLELRVIEVRE